MMALFVLVLDLAQSAKINNAAVALTTERFNVLEPLTRCG